MNRPLIASAEKGDLNHVLKLIKDGTDIDTADEPGRTAVLAATYANQAAVVKALIQHGADINIRDQRLDNVLLHAGAAGTRTC